MASHIDILPDEILDLLFEYISTSHLLTICTRVCKRWRLIIGRRTLALRRETDIQRLRGGIQALMILSHPRVTVVLDNVISKLTYLRELTASATTPFLRSHVVSLQQLRHLQHLDVFLEARILDEQLIPVAKHLHTLVVNENTAPRLFRQLSTGSLLVSLHMFGRSVYYIRKELRALLRARATHLRELTLRCSELMDIDYVVISNCINLVELRLYSCWYLTSAGALALCRLTPLRILHITSAKMLRRQALINMLSNLPLSIQNLVLSNGSFGDEHVPVLSKRLPHLRSVELWKCQLSKSGALMLAASLPLLEQLDLDLKLTKECWNILSTHPTLRQVRCVPMMTDNGIDRHIEGQYTWNLNGLHIISAHASYPHHYFRPGGEGFQSTLFYYWTRDIHLEPVTGLVSLHPG